MKRRQFLVNSKNVALSSAYFYGLQSLLDTCLKTNLVYGVENTSSLNYLNIQLPGAPPRWFFDQPLNPLNQTSDLVTGAFGTEIVKNGAKFEVLNKGYKIKFGNKDVFLPPVWNLKSAANGLEFKTILDNTMMIRGIDMEINSHTVNQARIVRPVTSSPSVHGLLADKSQLPLAATGTLNSYASRAFKSQQGLSLVQVNPANPIPALTSAFKATNVRKVSEINLSTKRSMAALDEYAQKQGFPSVGSEKQQMAAYEMFERNLTAFNSQWQSLYAKYQNIISMELRANFPGITDIDPVSDNSLPFRYDRSGKTVTGNLKSKIIATTNINRLAQAFAFAEFAITEKLSPSITVDATPAILFGVQELGNISNDQHFLGSVASTFYTSLFYRSFLGCLVELKSALQSAGLFDTTVIHIMSEFSRIPRADGAGADHGFKGTSTTIISGMIKTPGLIGNIRKESIDSITKVRYPGTWGEAAPFFADSRSIVNDDIVNTICEMLEIQKIAVKGQSLIKKVSGQAEWSSNWGFKNV